MTLFNPWRLFVNSAVRTPIGAKARKQSRGGPQKPARKQPAESCLIERLEDRLLLSATASPTFVLFNHTPNAVNPDAANPAAGVAPIDPAQMRAAYGVNQISFNGTAGTGAGQTIALVDAYNDPDIISDANSFSSRFGLQQFNVTGGPTLKVLNENGGTSLPANSSPGGWDVEEALDVEWAHSIAPQANIILFEASSNSYSDLMQAVSTAADYAGVSAVSMSWGGGEFAGENSYDSLFTTPAGHQGVTFFASAGDDGSPALYPAYSPNVVAVGGTSLDIDTGGDYLGESAWSDTGGGISEVEAQPSYQVGHVNGLTSTDRAAPDVSMDADPDTGVYVLDSFDGGYFQVGGTSLSSPMWAGLVAIANQGRALQGESSLDGPSQTLPALYNLPSSDFHDITTGSNGTYSATVGYDLLTGLGTPVANLLVPALAGDSGTQPPSLSGPSSGSLNENGSLMFSTGEGNAFSLADSQADGNAETLSLSVTDGALALGSTSGVSITAGANHSNSMTISGTLTNLSGALNGLVYTPNTNFNGSDTLNIYLSDPGDHLSASVAVALSVNAPTAPSVTAPASSSVNENTTLTFSSGQITLADASAGGSSDTLTLTAGDGNITLASTTGLTFLDGTSNDSSSITVSGTLANLSAAVSGLTYVPYTGYTGSDELLISLTDPGDTLSDSANVNITVNAVPTVAAPGTASVLANSTFAFSGGNAVSVADAAAGANPEQLVLRASHGKLRLGSTAGLTFVSGGNNTVAMTFKGTLANVNNDLSGLVYAPTAGYTGSDSLTIAATDTADHLTSATASVGITVGKAPTIASAKSVIFTVGTAASFSARATGFPAPTFGETGSLPSGITFNTSTGVLSGTANAGSGGTYHLTISASNGFGTPASQSFTLTVYEHPSVSAPATASLNENAPMVFSSGNGNAITVADNNAGTGAQRLNLTATHGKLQLATTTGIRIIGGANKSASMSVSGTLASLNAALNGLTLTPAVGYVGGASLAVSIKDMTTGLLGSASIGTTVNAVDLAFAEAGQAVGQFGDDLVTWAGLSAAVDELYGESAQKRPLRVIQNRSAGFNPRLDPRSPVLLHEQHPEPAG